MIAGIVMMSSVLAPVPDVSGQELVRAIGSLRDAGYERVKTTDVSGRGRVVVLRRSWKVCAQRPAAGAAPVRERVELAVVKVGESCPVGAPEQVRPGLMPNLQGKSVRVARRSLPGRTTVRINDATGRNRIVFWDTAWRVCTQTPAAAARLEGPVSLGVVKYGESCP
ncbi:hypothetical protein ACFXJ8_04405 [Nonomuraea sp. NPDC059194]|uniref:hypothetical protein n=1 Tax=Nonomuraea sp. NPDC059194 TaxID=3346764 RepID=UPI0036CF08DC